MSQSSPPIENTVPKRTLENRVCRTPPARPGSMPTQPVATVGRADVGRQVLKAVCRFAPSRRVPPDSDRRSPGRRRYDRRLWLSRWLYLVLVIATTAIGARLLWTVLRVDGTSVLEGALLTVSTILLGWIAISFWLACFGLYARLRGVPLDGLDRPAAVPPRPRTGRPRTAIVMPVYNEDVNRVFAGLTATCESLRDAGGAGQFDVYVLSDTTDAAIQAAEEQEWHRTRAALDGSARLYYRHRERNIGRKSGNIADFCVNWGRLYAYMVVADADSLMTGETLLELVRLMDANPRAGLIQTVPRLVGRDSLFGRIQQFACSVYGPVYASGQAFLQGGDGNYWGHNAIIRIAPFMRHCGMPVLPGKPPFGGEIMSHDFVEAALLRRGGWEIWLCPDLGGSYEEAPPTVADHLARDRRWFQGNLQHARLILTKGLCLPSRLHLAVGIMSYLSSPLWLVQILLSGAEAYVVGRIEQVSYIGTYPVLVWADMQVEAIAGLIAMMVVLLFGPKVMGLALLARDRELTRAHGGFRRLAVSVLWENAFSILFAPVCMVSHTRFGIDIVLGRATTWNSQNRGDRALPLADVAHDFALHTAIGVMAALIAWLVIPQRAGWLLPIVVGPILAIPMICLLSGAQPGQRARERLLFLIPTETRGERVVNRLRWFLGPHRDGAVSAAE